MASLAPGVYVSVTTAPPSPNGNPVTGSWFVTGETTAGPTGVAVPVSSLTDYINYFGTRVSYGYLYDALDEFFHDGGVQAYVSRVTGPAAASAQITLNDRAGSPLATLQIKAAGSGAWGNNLAVVVANGSASNSYTLQITKTGAVIETTPNLFTPQDAVNWFNSLPVWQVPVIVTNSGSATPTPNNNPATGTFTLTGGSDNVSGVTETQWSNALAVFTEEYGPGQVSAPGHTTTAGHTNLLNHAEAFNRVALLDVADSATYTSLVTQAETAQGDAIDPSYGNLAAPWLIIPGIVSTAPGTSSPVPVRTIPASALFAAKMALNDQTNDANNPAAGPNGTSNYVIGVTQQYSQTALGALNAAGISIVKPINNVPTIYGYVSLATDPNWIQLNWVRFRMQIINDFDNIGNDYMFSEIDGKGQLFARFGGALATKCQQYYTNNSLYGATASTAFSVNVGPQVNTPQTIAAGQLNAQVLVRMSPFAQFVQILVVKYQPSATLPTVS